MIDSEVKTEILRRIASAEQEHKVKVLYAVESGSRAWGFPSPNSDYDVRFIYAHPRDWYLSIDVEAKRDVIEYPIVDEIDINGWDLRKALQLFRRSNPTIVEWLLSPIVYRDDRVFAAGARELLTHSYSVEKGIYHYRSMAKTTYKTHLLREQVSLKKYFYALRPLLAIRWLEAKGGPAPIEFDKLRAMLDEPVASAIEALLELKKVSKEKQLGPRIPVLNDFIEQELARLDDYSPDSVTEGSAPEHLNQLFRSLLA